MKWIALCVALVACAAGIWYAVSTSPGDGTATPDTSASLPDGALAAVTLPTTFTSQEDVGQRAFDAVCAACHGANAQGRDGKGPPLVHRIYEPGHHGDMAFVIAAQNGVRAHHWKFGDMPPVEGVTRADVLNIVAYVRALQRANGIE